MAGISSLQKQRDDQRFRRAVDYVAREANGIKKITTSELAHLNQTILDNQDSPWRLEEVDIQLPSGQLHTFNLVSNPVTKARDILGIATQMAGNGDTKEAAFFVYSELVLAHLFTTGNRRTAVLATIWILESGGISVDAQKLLDIPLGDLRQKADRDAFVAQFERLLYPNRP